MSTPDAPKARKPRRKHALKAATTKPMKKPPAPDAPAAPIHTDESPYTINHTDIFTTAVLPHQFPDQGLPEIAFVGKSNVGKSSLINAMLGRKRLARTSGTPGKTRTINFFHVEEKILFADLPGYGYARISKSESEKWGKMIEGYLANRAPLRRIFILVDIRHEPGPNDIMIYNWCRHYQLPYTVVATKADKLNRSQLTKHLTAIKKGLGLDALPTPFSSDTKQGRDTLWEMILADCDVTL